MRFCAACILAIPVAIAAGISSAGARSHHGYGHHQGSQPASAASTAHDTTKAADHAPPQTDIKAPEPQGQSGREFKPANAASTPDDTDRKGERGRQGFKEPPSGPKGESAHPGMPEHTVTPGANAHAGSTDEIDTRITTVQPRWRNGKAPKQQHSKFVIVKPRQNLSTHGATAFGARKGIARDSIGVAIAHPKNEHGQNEPDHDLVRPSAPASPGITANAPKNAGPVDRRLLPQPKLEAKLNPVPFNSGTIGPPGPGHPHNAPGQVGGSPRLTAGLSGNMFRPKY
jgi:hypothetical protein